MATTLNISVSEDQAAWIKSRKAEAGFASVSDVVRDLIRREREKELAEFLEMSRRDGADGPEPVDEIVNTVRKGRKELIKRYRSDRRS